MKDNITDIERDMPILWQSVKQNKVSGDQAKVFIRGVGISAICAAVEAIQVAAMCEKFMMSFDMEEKSKSNSTPQNADKVYCRDCKYLNTEGNKPFCCHSKMNTNGLDDWCYHGKRWR